MYLVAAARRDDAALVRAQSPGLWRRVRRFNLPVQLALAAAEVAVAGARDRSGLLLASLAPCNGGSPEIHRWVLAIVDAAGSGDVQRVRMNPTHTLHAVDNLALSSLAIDTGNRGAGHGFGGAAGMVWEALDAVGERLTGRDEALLVAGDQDDGVTGAGGLGVAVLLSADRRPYCGRDHAVAVTGIDRARGTHTPTPHAAAGLAALLDALDRMAPGDRLRYEVPAAHGDGIDRIVVTAEAA